ncbi:Ca2+-binding protein, RTX toxin-related, partial [Polaromonas sp. JS666]
MTQPFEYAMLSGDAYSDTRQFNKNDAPIPQGWTELTKYAISGSGPNANFLGSGFSARVYRDVTGEIVIAYAGTQFGGSGAGQAGDWLAGNMPLAVGLLGPQAVAAAELYQRVVADLGNNITFTGHSLGGGLAAMMAVYFDRPAKVFAPAPFGKSADPTQYALGALGPLAAIRAKLFANALIDPHLGGIPEALADFSPGGDYTARSAKVQAWAVKGEILEKTLFLLPFIETSGTRISLFTAGETELGMTAKHSIDLHAAGLMSPTFNKWAATLPSALPLVFDRTFYAVDLITGREQDFLVWLSRNQIGVADTAPNAMLSHFANDLQKMGVNMAGLSRAAQDALTAQGIEWYFWQDGNYAGQEFFTQTGNLLQYTSAQGAGLEGAQNKAMRYVDTWLNSVATAHGTFAELSNYDQWNVVSGNEGATAIAKDGGKTQIFIGGGGGDTLIGGNTADTFYAGGGDDTLNGGAGTDMLAGGNGNDTYQFTGEFGADTIIDSDGQGRLVVDDNTLKGGKKVEGLDNVWRNAEQGYTFVLAGGGADRGLRVIKDNSLDAIRIKGWQDGQLGLVMDTSAAPPTVVQHIYNGDQRGPLVGGVYDWSSTHWGDDGGLIGGVAEENFYDVILGTRDRDLINGLGGKDVLQGWLGDDEINGGEGDDLIAGGPGRDLIHGGAGDDVIMGAGTFYYLDYNPYSYSSVQAWNPVFGVNALAQVQFDPAGMNQWINSAQTWVDLTSPDPDVISAGDGDDIVFGSGYDDVVAGDGDEDLLWGMEGNDIMAGGDGGDILVGDVDGVDYAQRRSLGSDVPSIIYGKDFLDGGDGNDVLLGGGAGDALYGGTGNDLLSGDGSSGLLLDGNYSNHLVSPGQQGDDFLDGGDGDDTLMGAGGNDVLIGGAGIDMLDGGTGNDSFSAGAGDTVVDSEGTDALILADGLPVSVTTDNADLLLGYGNLGAMRIVDALRGSIEFIDGIRLGDWLKEHLNEAVYVESSGEDQSLSGGSGNDILAAGHARVRLSGEAGNDAYIVDHVGVMVVEEADDGTDTVQSALSHTLAENVENLTLTGTAAINGTGNTSDNVLIGNAAANALTGGAGNDTLNGGDGDDMLYGEGGNDLLYASRGNDTLAGGDGLDTYVLNYSADCSNVLDDSAEGSVIKLGAAGMKFEDLYAVRRANDLLVEVRGTSASMRIKDYYASTQTSWVFEDAQGNTTTGEALVAASRPEWTLLQADLLKDFQSSALGSISQSYQDNGYTQRADGSWYLPIYTLSFSSYYAEKIEHAIYGHQLMANLNVVWYTQTYSTIYAGWEGVSTAGVAEDTTVTVSTQANIVDGSDIVLQSYSQSASDQAAWGSVRWALGQSGHNETPWVREFSYFWPYEDPTEVISRSSRYEMTYESHDGTNTSLTFQDPGAAAVSGNLPDYVAVNFVHNQHSFNLGPSLLADGDHTVWADENSAVIGGVGNNVIHGAGFAYGGTGNAQLIGGGTLMAGTGDQYLQGGKIMAVGDGHDTVVGRTGSHILVNPDNQGIDLIGYDFNPETDVDGMGRSLTIGAIYQAMGYQDWKENFIGGGKFYFQVVETFSGYFDSVEDARAAFNVKPRWLTFDEAMARDDTEWRYVEPLPVLYTTPYSSFGIGPGNDYLPSSYYDTHPVPAVVLTANNFAVLQPLADADLMPGGVVSFGPGLALADLTLSWGEVAVPLDGVTHVTLDIVWGTDQGIRIMMPRTGDALNSVVQQFEFSDGTVSSLLDLIVLAPRAPDFERTHVMSGTAGADKLIGSIGRDALYGLAGNDTLNGGAGADMLVGGPGDDTYTVDNAGDVVVELAGEGTDTVKSSIGYTLGAEIENLVLTGTAAVNGVGNAGNNTLTGNTAANTLTGGEGNDTLSGGAGPDTMIGGAGNDSFTVDDVRDVAVELADEGTDTVRSSVNYTLGAEIENLVLTGTAVINGVG